MEAAKTINKVPPPTPRNYTLKDVDWLHASILIPTPLIALYGVFNVPMFAYTMIWAVLYYYVTGFGITAGYHRYWSHRSYDASIPFELFLAFAGTGAVEGSIKWWSRGHRAHHRYTDQEKDPYDSRRGLFWAHIGWMLVKQDPKNVGRVDISDLNRNAIVTFQHKYYLPLAIFAAFVFPTLVAGLGWGDYIGGFFFAGVARLVFVHHATFCVNSLAHWLGDATFDAKHTPKDHFFTALVTLGEGYHNFHHEFPSDYRNAIKFWQYDPTKWLIWGASTIGLTHNLKMFPDNEIKKGRIQMQQQKIDEIKKTLSWGVPLESLKTLTWKQYENEVESGKFLVVIEGIVYNVEKFADQHPGGKGFLKAAVGRDTTQSFNGGIYDHSNAARNLLTTMRYAKLEGSAPSHLIAKEE